MKLLFFSCDCSEIEQVGRNLLEAGIPCWVQSREQREMPANASCAELWIQNDCDHHRASMLCVQLQVEFSRPASRTDTRLWVDAER
jgi:hypothetical protein